MMHTIIDSYQCVVLGGVLP